MIRETSYKGRRAYEVSSRTMRALFLPDDGAKMASLIALDHGKELLASKQGESYKVLTYDGCYVDSECSAFDDLCPTIDPYTPTDGAYAGIAYPDHGEACRLAYRAEAVGDTLALTAFSKCFPVLYRKTVSVGKEDGIILSYSIENTGEHPFPFLWAGHIMLQGEDGIRLRTPFPEDAPLKTVFHDGKAMETLPLDRLCGYESNGAAYKFYYLDKMKDGFFALDYPDGHTLSFTFDREKLPYLGVWLNNGEFQGLYSITPEPCTSPFDAPHKAENEGYPVKAIPPKSKFEFQIHIHWQSKENL